MSITPGYHVAAATKFEYAESEKKKTPFIKVFFEILEGKLKGKTTSWSGYLTPGAAKVTIIALRRAGWSGEQLDDTMEGLGSVKVILDVQEEEYEGKVFSRVQWINEYGKSGGGIKASKNQIGDDSLSKLNASLANVLITVPPVEASPEATIDGTAVKLKSTTEAGSLDFGEDDIPF